MMRLLAWAAWACAEAAGVAFVERIVSAYAPNVAAIFAADANGDGRIEVWSAADGAYGLRSYEHNWRHDLPDEYDTYVLEAHAPDMPVYMSGRSARAPHWPRDLARALHSD